MRMESWMGSDFTNDDLTLALDAMLYGGESGSEFGGLGQTYYLNFKVTF